MSTQAVSVPADHVVSLRIENLTNDWETYAVPFETPEKTRMVSINFRWAQLIDPRSTQVLPIRVKQTEIMNTRIDGEAGKHRSMWVTCPFCTQSN